MENQEYVWNRLAESWYNFRNKPEKFVIYFKERYANKRGKIIDLGCGNCRNLIPFKDYYCYCVDFSKEMLDKAKLIQEKYNINLKLIRCDISNLKKFEDSYFDYALMTASLHHLPNKELRLRALEELHRILKKDGIALVTVWNKWQPRFLLSKKDNFVKWKVKNEIYYRYYYLFNYFELKRLIKENNFRILKSKFGRNLIFIVKEI